MSQRRSTLAPTMFSKAMYTIERAINTSMRGGNQSALGAKSNADAINVIEWATVNDVTMTTSGRTRRNGMTRQRRNSR